MNNKRIINWWSNFKIKKTSLKEKKDLLKLVYKGNISGNFYTKKLEKKLSLLSYYKYCVFTTSGSAALLLTLLDIGFKKNDEIILPDIGWIAAANAAKFLNIKIILAPVDERLLLDLKQIKNYINKNTRAIIPINFNGNCVNLNELKKKINKNIKIINDSAQSFLSENKNYKSHNIANYEILSFGPTKLFSSGFGGAVLTNSKKIYLNLMLLKDHGFNRNNLNYEKHGFNFKNTDLSSFILLKQLTSEEINLRKKKLIHNYNYYLNELENIKHFNILSSCISDGELPLQVILITKYAKDLSNYLKKNAIETSFVNKTLYSAKYLNIKNDIDKRNLNKLIKNNYYYLKLPSGCSLNHKQIIKTIKVIKNFNENYI